MNGIQNCLIFSIFLSFYFATVKTEEHFKCDIDSFGDPNFNYSYVYYNQTHTLKVNTQKLEIVLPRDPGDMISFVCVSAPTLRGSARASFAAIDATVTVSTDRPAGHDAAVTVIARKHPY